MTVEDTEKLEFTGQQIAQLCAISPRRVRELANEGKIPRLDNGMYPAAAIAQHCKNLRERAEHAVSDTRERERELKCKVMEQKLEKNIDAMRCELIGKIADESREWFLEYRRALQEVGITDEAREKLNEALDIASVRIEDQFNGTRNELVEVEFS